MSGKERVIRDTALRELEELTLLLDSDPEVINSMSTDEVRAELREMGIDPDMPPPWFNRREDNVRSSVSPCPVELFISYAHKDEKLRNQLVKHLTTLEQQGIISAWHDRKLVPGVKWENEINNHLDKAEVILLLVSPDFIASNYCYSVEFERAMKRYEAGEARVLPVILRPVDWESSLLGKFQALPTNGIPVTRWEDRDEAFLNIVRGIRGAVEKSFGRKPERGLLKIIAEAAHPEIAKHEPGPNLSLMGVLKEAMHAVPAVKFALGVAGIAAAVAIVAGFSIDYKVAVFGTIIMFGLMFCLVLFSSFARYASASVKPLALTLAWTFVLLISATSFCIFTGFFFSWPRSLETYVGSSRITLPAPTGSVETPPTPGRTANTQSFPPARSTQAVTDAIIRITVRPPYDPVGGPNSKAKIAGEVSGVPSENYRVVIYALTDRWYVQPTTAEPLTDIGQDGKWKAEIQTGTRYVALLVSSDYNPTYTTSTHPRQLGGVLASTEIEGRR